MLCNECRKRKVVRQLIPLVALLVAPAFAFAEPLPAPSVRYRISVVTVGKGDALFTQFGHTGMLLKDLKTNSMRLYNFGEFDYRQPGLIRKFLRGQLRFYTSLSDFRTFKGQLAPSKRSLTEQELALNDEETASIVSILESSVLPQNRTYEYHYYFANCTTRVRDIIDTALHGRLRRAQNVPSKTLRYYTDRSCADAPVLRLLFRLILNHRVDRPIPSFDALYLPDRLATGLAAVHRADGTPLVTRTELIFQDGRAMASKTSFVYLLILCIACAAVVTLGAPMLIGPIPAARTVLGCGLIAFGLLSSAAAMLMILLWALTPYAEMQANGNLLLFPPTHLLFVRLGIAFLRYPRLLPPKRAAVHRALKRYSAIAAGLLLFDIGQRIWNETFVNAPFLLFTAVCIVFIYLSARKIRRTISHTEL